MKINEIRSTGQTGLKGQIEDSSTRLEAEWWIEFRFGDILFKMRFEQGNVEANATGLVSRKLMVSSV